VELTLLDVSWELAQLLAAPSWLGDQVTHARTVVLVAPATVPGMRRLEGALAWLPATPTVAAVVGPARRRRAGVARCGAGRLTGALDDAGQLVMVPADRRLAVAGLDSTPLPARLVAAATRVLRLVGPGQSAAGGAG
jgi:anti-sigma factor RsiW